MARPLNPTNLKAVYIVDGNQVKLTWAVPTSSPPTTGLGIQRYENTTGIWSDLAQLDVPTNAYIDSSVTAGRYYVYRMESINADGVSMGWSTESNAIRIRTVPVPADGESAQRWSDNSISVYWKVHPTVLAPIDYNKIYRWNNISNEAVYLDKTDGDREHFLDTTAPNDRGVKYLIHSVNDVGGAAIMTPYTGFVYTTPAPATQLTARWVEQDILLSWVNPSTIASNFNIEHSTDGIEWFPVADVGVVTTWRHVGPERGVQHKYRIRPLSPMPAVGERSIGEWTVSAFVPASGTPNAPTILGPVFAPAGVPFTMEIRHNSVDGSPMGAARVRHRLAGETVWEQPVLDTLQVPAYGPSSVEVQASTRTTDSAFGVWSPTTTVRVKARPVPVLTSPSNGAVVTGPLLPLAWTAGTQTAFEAELYEGVTLIQTRSGTTARTVSFNVEDDKSYAIRFRMSDGELWSSWITRTLTTSFASPASPVLTISVDSDNLNVAAHISAVVDTQRRELLRREAGSVADWVSVGFTDGFGFIFDPLPPLGVELEYAAIAWGANNTSGVSPVSVVTVDRHVVVVNYGPALGASAYLEVDLKAINAKVQRERALHKFAGRTLPVVVQGDSVSHSISVSGRVVDELGSSAQVWREMVTTPGDKWFRDPEGRSFLCSIESVQINQQNDFLEVSFTADEVEKS